MKIKSLKVNGYGKLKNKDIDLSEDVNIIEGKNETGKSTLLNFISSMFYGIRKVKDKKDISDYNKYNPWEGETFSGKISYSLDNNDEFEIYRDFKKKESFIYDKNQNDITNKYEASRENGLINVLNEQTGIDRDTFENTVLTCQDEIVVDDKGQKNIIQKISNIVSSGDETISYNDTMSNIKKELHDKVGSSKTTKQPLNVVLSKIDNLKLKKKRLEDLKHSIESNTNDIEKLNSELKVEEKKLQILNEYKDVQDENKSLRAEIDVNKDLKDKYLNHTNELEESKKALKNENSPRANSSFKGNIIFIVVLTILTFFLAFLDISAIIPGIVGLVDVAILIGTLFSKRKIKNDEIKIENDFKSKIKKIDDEIEIVKGNISDTENVIFNLEKEIDLALSKKKTQLINNYEDELHFINDIFDMDLDELKVCIKNTENRINSIKLEVNTKEVEIKNTNKELEELPKIEEELLDAENEKDDLESLERSYMLAQKFLGAAYNRIRDSLSPEFTNELCKIINVISNGKYKRIKFSDKDGLTVEIENGKFIEAKNLSIGTIDQMYLALRISTLNTITKENMPIILDEAFAYFDDERLKNILNFIYTNYKGKQVIIFTCSKREKNILDDLNLKYKLIEL